MNLANSNQFIIFRAIFFSMNITIFSSAISLQTSLKDACVLIQRLEKYHDAMMSSLFAYHRHNFNDQAIFMH
ncbi:hypothetical protein B0T21DRAFT_368904 [Apiosordaria backusii]|uniref:Uncharacterized protein n=1 Tax=Apiosordaria backusii TaxID=314023 RepID=A0AA40BDU9_9PEZI|nr:hypothetical protein B0T21DRAFT_368904 [Apiosordaria backusii]